MAQVYGKPLLTENERRALFNYDEIPNGEVILVPTGYETLDTLLSTPDTAIDAALKALGDGDYK